jgi:hypothetical protein
MINKYINSPSSLPGIALMEVMVSLFILVLGTISSITLANYLLKTTVVTRDQVIAANLAREGLEVIRNVRDTNWQANSGSQRDADNSTRDHWNDHFGMLPTNGVELIPVLQNSGINSMWQTVHTKDTGTEHYDAVCISVDSYLGSNSTDTKPHRTQVYFDVDGTMINPCNVSPVDMEPTKFQRYLIVTYLTPNGDAATDGPVNETREIWVQSVVNWYESTDPGQWNTTSPPHSVTLTTNLTDWYGRDAKDAP